MPRAAVTPKGGQVGIGFLAGQLRDELNIAHQCLALNSMQRFRHGFSSVRPNV